MKPILAFETPARPPIRALGSGIWRGLAGLARRIGRGRTPDAERLAMIVGSLESLDQGFALFDAHRRLVMCNSRYRKAYPQIADRLVEGALFEDILRLAAIRGRLLRDTETLEGWIAERLARPLASREPARHRLGDGECYLISEQNTPEGGIVKLLTRVPDDPGQGATSGRTGAAPAKAPAQAPATPRAARIDLSGKRLLVVDDDAPIATMIQLMLQEVGADARVANSAEQALIEVDRTGTPDLVITDVMMPGMNGPGLAEVLRARDPALKVLFTSGIENRRAAHHRVLPSDVPCLYKPLRYQNLIDTVETMLAGD